MTRLKELREKFGYTQDYVSECINVSRITYIRYESDARQMKAPELVKLASLYNVSIEHLLGIDDSILLDTKKDPSPEDRERALAAASAALSGDLPTQSMPQDVEALTELIQQIVRQELDTRSTPSDGQ